MTISLPQHEVNWKITWNIISTSWHGILLRTFFYNILSKLGGNNISVGYIDNTLLKLPFNKWKKSCIHETIQSTKSVRIIQPMRLHSTTACLNCTVAKKLRFIFCHFIIYGEFHPGRELTPMELDFFLLKWSLKICWFIFKIAVVLCVCQ